MTPGIGHGLTRTPYGNNDYATQGFMHKRSSHATMARWEDAETQPGDLGNEYTNLPAIGKQQSISERDSKFAGSKSVEQLPRITSLPGMETAGLN